MEMARMSCSFAFNGLRPCSTQVLAPSAHSRSNSAYKPQACASSIFSKYFYILNYDRSHNLKNGDGENRTRVRNDIETTSTFIGTFKLGK